MNKFPVPVMALVVPLGLLGCSGAAPAPGTQPHDMSGSEHQAAAQQEEQAAEQHSAQHDPHAVTTEEKCTFGQGSRTAEVCWDEYTNPTEEHEKIAREHRELAAQHRAAAAALATAETSECKGVSEMDRDMSPFAHKADIRSVTRLGESGQPAYSGERRRLVGATVVFDAVPGMTAEWLQKVVDCHLARNAAMGHEVPEMAYCPLTLKGVTAKVRSVGDGFAVDIQSPNQETAGRIWRLAQNLAPNSASTASK